MKTLALIFLLQTSLLFAADQPSSSDFPLKIHIISSKTITQYSSRLTLTLQVVQTVIDGQQIELTANAGGVLALSDYPARVSTSVHAPKNWSAYDLVKGYDFLMPDNKIRTFTVTAIGPPPANP